MRIISKDYEHSIGIFDFFIKFFSKPQKYYIKWKHWGKFLPSMVGIFHFRAFSYFDYSRAQKVKSIKVDFTISNDNNSKLKKKHFFSLYHFVILLLIFIAPYRFPLFICQVASILAEQNLPKWVLPRGN